MQIYRFILSSVLAGVFIFGTTGCTTTGNITKGIQHTSLTDSMKKTPKSFRPYSAEYKGELTPTTGIKNVISGNTLVLVQPWANLKGFELRETPVYFHKNGTANSELWLGIPWSIRGNELCMTGENVNNCYKAFADSTGQAYLMVESNQLLAKVKSIESGDSHNTKAAYQARQEKMKAQQEMKLMFAGLLFEAFTSGGGSSGGNAGYDDEDYYEQGSSPSYNPSTQPVAPIHSNYGVCHSPMGC